MISFLFIIYIIVRWLKNHEYIDEIGEIENLDEL